MKSKKTLTKFALMILGVFCASFFLFSFSCSSEKTAAKLKNTVFADNSPAVSMPEDALAVVEALQSAFRSVSSEVLPSVLPTARSDFRIFSDIHQAEYSIHQSIPDNCF